MPAEAGRRFALTASDRYLGVFEAFVEAGWTPLKLFTHPMDGVVHRNQAVIDKAQSLGMDIQLSRMTDHDLAGLAAQGCELLVVASYPWRIGPWQAHLPRAINFHPSPLPRYRGPFPQVWAILDAQRDWAVSCHRVDNDFDAGDVLASQSLQIDAHDDFDRLDMKIQLASRLLAQRVSTGLDALWAQAAPQHGGLYRGFWPEQARTLDFHQGSADIDRRLRAFGPLGCRAVINGIPLIVHKGAAWSAPCAQPPGHLVHADGTRLLVSCGDGVVFLERWQHDVAAAA